MKGLLFAFILLGWNSSWGQFGVPANPYISGDPRMWGQGNIGAYGTQGNPALWGSPNATMYGPGYGPTYGPGYGPTYGPGLNYNWNLGMYSPWGSYESGGGGCLFCGSSRSGRSRSYTPDYEYLYYDGDDSDEFEFSEEAIFGTGTTDESGLGDLFQPRPPGDVVIDTNGNVQTGSPLGDLFQIPSNGGAGSTAGGRPSTEGALGDLFQGGGGRVTGYSTLGDLFSIPGSPSTGLTGASGSGTTTTTGTVGESVTDDPGPRGTVFKNNDEEDKKCRDGFWGSIVNFFTGEPGCDEQVAVKEDTTQKPAQEGEPCTDCEQHTQAAPEAPDQKEVIEEIIEVAESQIPDWAYGMKLLGASMTQSCKPLGDFVLDPKTAIPDGGYEKIGKSQRTIKDRNAWAKVIDHYPWQECNSTDSDAECRAKLPSNKCVDPRKLPSMFVYNASIDSSGGKLMVRRNQNQGKGLPFMGINCSQSFACAGALVGLRILPGVDGQCEHFPTWDLAQMGDSSKKFGNACLQPPVFDKEGSLKRGDGLVWPKVSEDTDRVHHAMTVGNIGRFGNKPDPFSLHKKVAGGEIGGPNDCHSRNFDVEDINFQIEQGGASYGDISFSRFEMSDYLATRPPIAIDMTNHLIEMAVKACKGYYGETQDALIGSRKGKRSFTVLRHAGAKKAGCVGKPLKIQGEECLEGCDRYLAPSQR